jgi:hypothetical protein
VRPGVASRRKPSSPLLSAVPVVNILTNLIFRESIPLLNLSFELIPTATDDIEIVVGELAPPLLDLAFDLLPISFNTVPVHLSSPYDE